MSERRRSRRRFLLQESPTSHSATSHEASSLGAGRSFLKFGCQQYEKVEEWPKDFQNSMRDCKGCLGTPCYCTIKDLHWAMSGLRYYWLVTLEPPKNVSFRKCVPCVSAPMWCINIFFTSFHSGLIDNQSLPKFQPIFTMGILEGVEWPISQADYNGPKQQGVRGLAKTVANDRTRVR